MREYLLVLLVAAGKAAWQMAHAAVQAIGAAAGNMVAIHNVVAASATVGLLGREGTTLRKTVWPTLYYVLFTGLIALFAIYGLGIGDPLLAR